jgi:hypothetical protein
MSGFFHEQTGYNYGEVAGDRPTELLIDRLVEMKQTKLEEIGLCDRLAAERFSADATMPVYVEHVQHLLARAKRFPEIRHSSVMRAVISGFLASRVPIVRGYWRRHNWHHPAQDK